MAKSKVSVSKVLGAWREVQSVTDRSAGVVLGGDRLLVAAAEQRFSTGGTSPGTWTRPIAELSGFSSAPGEVLVLFVDPQGEAEALAALSLGVARGGVVLAVDEAETGTGKVTHPCDGCARVSFSDSERGWRQVFEACAELGGEYAVALGRRYPAVRTAAARRVVLRTATQNAFIGAALFIPGADMPAMTLNQARMMLSLAAIYGAEISRERAVELMGLVGVGLGFRTAARTLLRSAPGVGWLVKAGTGFAGTLAVGFAAMRYFEQGAPAATSRVMALAGQLKR